MDNPGTDNDICESCGLYMQCKSPFMESYGSETPKYLIIGEAPGDTEDKTGIPFVGEAGKLLRKVLEGLDVDVINDVRFTNVVRCRPPKNVITKRYITDCSNYALDDIIDYQPEVIMLMGNSPLQGILGETGITHWNGAVINKTLHNENGEWTGAIVPLYHPAYILRDNSHMDEWLVAMSNAIDPLTAESGMDLVYPHTVDDVIAMRDYLNDYEDVAYDTETASLNAFDETSMLLAVSFSAGNKAYSLPVYHPDAWWDKSDIVQVTRYIREIIRSHSGHIIGHNIKFDAMHTYVHLHEWVQPGGDVMLISHLLDSKPGGHGLKRLASIHLGMYGYDAELNAFVKANRESDVYNGGSYAFVPLSILLPYSAKDALATAKLNDVLLPKLSKRQRILYDEVIIPVCDSLTLMQCNGLKVDPYIVNYYKKLYKIKQHEYLCDINADPLLRKMMKSVNKKVNATKKKKVTIEFNPNSSAQLSVLWFDYHKIPVMGRTDTGKPSTKHDLYKRMEEDYPIIRSVRLFKMMTKMLSTYLEPCLTNWISDDGRVRTTYNQHGTVTGRLSSSQPVNLQNIPTPEKEPGTLLEYKPIKNIFTHSDGCKLVGLDYSGMELRVFASLAKCYTMVDIHRSGLDFHSMVAALSMRMLSMDDVKQAIHNKEDIQKVLKKVDKATRYRYKWTNWTLLYGGGAETLHRMYDVPLDEANETVATYYELFPEVPAFMDWCVGFAEDHGYIESPFGRREHLPYITDSDRGRRNSARRAAVNMPVQSSAADITLIAVHILDMEMRKKSMQSKLVNTVHDSALCDCALEELKEFVILAEDVMVNVKTYAMSYMPRIPFKWLISPLAVDVEVGSHYGALESYEE
jgi:DNA polymerase I